jgi:lactate permease
VAAALAKVSGLDEMALSQAAGRQLPLFSLVIPVWLVAVMSGWKGVKGCWPATLVCGGSFATVQFLMSNYHGPTLVDVFGGIVSLGATTLLLRVWQPKEVWRFPDEESRQPPLSKDAMSTAPPPHCTPLTAGQVIHAWMPWLILSMMVFLWGSPAWKACLNGGTPEHPGLLHDIGKVTIAVPSLHNVVYRAAPVGKPLPGSNRAEHPEAALYDFNWLSTPGTCIFLVAAMSAVWLRISPWQFWGEFVRTLFHVRGALWTIACMLALALTTKYSGADATQATPSSAASSGLPPNS